jgi:hypothetical protein
MLNLITLSITVNIAMLRVHNFPHMLTIVMLSVIGVCHNAEVNYTQYKVKNAILTVTILLIMLNVIMLAIIIQCLCAMLL